MLKDLLVTITAGLLSAVPVAETPAVEVSASTVQSAVLEQIQDQEDRKLEVECDLGAKKLTISEDTPKRYSCLTTDKENGETFQTKITLTSVEGKIRVTATVDAEKDAHKVTDKSKKKNPS